jgi:hypothetical protein
VRLVDLEPGSQGSQRGLPHRLIWPMTAIPVHLRGVRAVFLVLKPRIKVSISDVAVFPHGFSMAQDRTSRPTR